MKPVASLCFRSVAMSLVIAALTSGLLLAADREIDSAPAEILKAEDIGLIEARSSALLLSGQRGGGVKGALGWTVAPSDGENTKHLVPYVIEVEGASLVKEQAAGRIPIGIFTYVMDLNGGLVSHRAQGLILDAADRVDALRAGGLKFHGRLELTPGTYSLRVMVRNYANADYFLTWTEIRVPDSQSGDLFMLPPVFADASFAWLSALQHDLTEIPAVFPGGSLPAAGRAVIRQGKTADLLLAHTRTEEETPLAARIVDEAGRTVAEPKLKVEPEIPGASTGLLYRRVTMEAMDLPPGDYNFVFQVGRDDVKRVRSATELTVSAGERPTSWVTAAALPAAGPPDLPTPGEHLTKRKEIRSEYLAALADLANGDRLKAQRAVADIERRVLAAGKGALMMTLRSLEQGEAARLAKRDATVLVPIIDLHRRLYRMYKVRRENRLATHAWMITADLAEMASKRQPKEIPDGFAEATLVGLASDLVQSSGMASAQTLLDRCLRISPANEAALLALGASYERLGEYEAAGKALRSLTRAHPGNLEAKLRLAVNLARTGTNQSSDILFRELISGDGPEWIKAIAFQEASRRLLERDRPGEAADLLHEAVGRLPSNQRLVIQLSFALDQAGRRTEATEVLQGLTTVTRSEAETPRYRYAEWPALVQSARNQFDDTATRSSIAALAAALDRERSGGRS